jgi:mRNA-degrading endonuclease RelE of RelBE toxin-antitoxin system
MTSAFSNSIIGIDRKLQGRILEAVADLTKNPLEIRGDTVKPLSGEFKGCWRYRIGDFRLIYSADRNSGDVTLVAFSPRGSAYKD